MSKKVFNVFSILCFALVLCFIGCTELINPKTETDINLNIDLSKIIKSTRNTGETQSSVSLGENPTIKVAIYDAKKYNATTNSTDNLDLITEAQAKIVNNEAKVKLNNIPVGIDAIVFAELSFSNGNSTEVMYAGNSEVFRVKPTDNKISLVLKKVGNSETYPDDTKPEESINAKEPIITTQPESHIKIYSSETGEYFTYELKITAESSDNGKISYKWQKLDNENWVDIENSSSEEINVTVSKNTSCVYRCVVTNTNENVNGEKTASIYSSEVTVAYVEGSLTSITAKYTGSYELLGKDFTYSNVSVTEIYTSSDNATEPTIITVFADESRYTISPNPDSGNAIGDVPYTVTRNDSNLTGAIITVPVKYELDANNLVLETCFNSSSVSVSDTDIKIPQYGTVKYVYQISDYYTIFLIDENGVNTEIKDINNTGYYTATIVDEKDQDIPNGSICTSEGSYTYTVTLESANEWFVCNSNNTSKDFSVKVCPWEIILTPSESTSTVDTNNISLGTYTLSISNEATCTNTTLPDATFSCSVDNINIISIDQLEIDDNFTKGTIKASIKINEEEVELASLEISRENTSVTYAKGLTCVVDSDYNTVTLYIRNADGLATFRNIVNGRFDSDIIVQYENNPNSTNTFSADKEYQNVNAVLESDITLSGDWTPIGVYSTTPTSAKPYSGTFDGNGKTITFENITHNDPDMYSSGLFQMLAGTVKNLIIAGNIFRVEVGYIGSITGYLDGGTIENCVNEALITNSATNGTGGIVGYVGTAGGNITGCINLMKVSSSYSTVGGIVGNVGNMPVNSNLTISKCINLGEISGESNISGILGNANTSAISISDCMNLGKISTNNTSEIAYASGITTPSENYTVSSCINVGEVTATATTSFQGGISSVTTKGIYTNNYYDSTVNSSVVDSSTSGITGTSTNNLIGSNISLNGISTNDWTFAEGRYPLPNIAGNIPGYEDGVIWSDVLKAATPEVTSGGGNDPLVGTEVASLSALQNAINGNDEVIIIKNNITITDPLVINKKIKICTSDLNYQLVRATEGTVKGPMFEVTSTGELTLQNIIITGGYDSEYNDAENNPFIYNNGKTVIENSTLKNNYLYYTGEYTNNESKSIHFYGGGAIFSNGDLTINNSSMENFYINSSGGGTIYIESGTCNIDGSTISGCTATKNGGGIYAAAGTISINNSEINNNSAQSGKSVYFKKNVIYSINSNEPVTVTTAKGYDEDITPYTSSININ